MGLFRKQVTEQQHGSQLGEIVLNQPIRLSQIFYLFVAMFIASVLYIANASYTQTQTVAGHLASTEGDITYAAPATLFVDALYIKNGQIVEPGTPLIRLTERQFLADGSEPGQSKIDQLHIQLDTIEAQKRQLKHSLENQKYNLQFEQQDITLKMKSLTTQLHQLKQQLQIAKRRKDEFIELGTKQLVSQYQSDEYTLKWLELTQQDVTLKQNMRDLEHQLVQVDNKLEAAIISNKQQYLAFVRQSSDKQIQLTQLQSQSTKLFVAQKAGVISTLDVKQGQRINIGQVMFSITPKQPTLYAELYVPSRAIGFIQSGSIANLKLQAFPFEKFGALQAEITNVPSTIINPMNKNGEAPIYQVVAALSKQSVNAYGNNQPLQNGMAITAEIHIERRSLAEWLFEPIIAAAGVY